MRYAQAKMRIWNPETYTLGQVHSAALDILASLDASPEDIAQAISCLRGQKVLRDLERKFRGKP